jgi:hypothetical protein
MTSQVNRPADKDLTPDQNKKLDSMLDDLAAMKRELIKGGEELKNKPPVLNKTGQSTGKHEVKPAAAGFTEVQGSGADAGKYKIVPTENALKNSSASQLQSKNDAGKVNLKALTEDRGGKLVDLGDKTNKLEGEASGFAAAAKALADKVKAEDGGTETAFTSSSAPSSPATTAKTPTTTTTTPTSSSSTTASVQAKKIHTISFGLPQGMKNIGQKISAFCSSIWKFFSNLGSSAVKDVKMATASVSNAVDYEAKLDKYEKLGEEVTQKQEQAKSARSSYIPPSKVLTQGDIKKGENKRTDFSNNLWGALGKDPSINVAADSSTMVGKFLKKVEEKTGIVPADSVLVGKLIEKYDTSNKEISVDFRDLQNSCNYDPTQENDLNRVLMCVVRDPKMAGKLKDINLTIEQAKSLKAGEWEELLKPPVALASLTVEGKPITSLKNEGGNPFSIPEGSKIGDPLKAELAAAKLADEAKVLREELDKHPGNPNNKKE